ncbi:hypothetical protein FGE05_07420 [Pseudomonas sp. ICMP22404]|uniref:hypothetical protein n=1 Tax=Pseudomonas TaxID=286 RepID=UPI00111B8AC1|nr:MULTISPECIES: hypothetical protein [Pseudomonas]MCI0996211.1 hypothetical protein [Pseudomonas corrugata]NUT64860.1 hypothetical protein [Pseudomonas corrugata]TNF84022.1 hypothetical protein FGE05_07420 [Pseudomonas sp. ICMP22404]
MLKVIEQQASASLRQRMEEAGCAFEFIVLAPEVGEVITPVHHRQAVDQLFLAIRHLWLERHRQMILDPRYADTAPPGMSWDLDKARAKPLDRQEVAQLMRTDREAHNPPPFALYEAFCEPPYGTRFGDGQLQALFREWLGLLGLEAGVEVEVLNWVDNFNLDWLASDEPDPARDPWSDYFDDGLEWWGVWCLSIWNPRRRTLSVLAASTTD